MATNTIKDLSLMALFAMVSFLLFLVYKPFLIILSLALAFAVIMHAPYERLVQMLRGNRAFSAIVIVSLTLCFFFLPIFFLGLQISQEAQTLFFSLQGNETTYLHMLQSFIQDPLQQWFPGFVFNINSSFQMVLAFVSNNIGSFVYQTLSAFFGAFLMLLSFFFFLRDGRSLLASFVKVSPFGEEITHEILNQMYVTIRSVVRGTLFIVLIRTVCIWAVFSVFGIPNALLWSSLGGVAGAIPGIGTAFAFVGAAFFFYVQGNIVAALGTAIAGVVAVVLVDNILTSYFFGKGLEASPIFVLFSILGGIIVFGPVGFLLGPLVLSVFLSVVRVVTLTKRA